MRAGQQVTYVEGRRKEAATVVALSEHGNGPSGHKLLDLRVGKKERKAVPHESDADAKGGFWRL